MQNFYILIFDVDMNYKIFVNKLMLVFVLFVVALALINYIIDPFQQYRISSWYKITGKKQRMVVPGLAKNLQGDTVIIGSSVTENFEPSYVNQVFKTDTLKLSVAGMTAHEMHYMLRILEKYNKRISHIIISLDLFALSGSPDKVRNPPLPVYMYDDEYFNDVKYLLNWETLKYSLRMMKQSNLGKTNFDELWYWGSVDFSEKAVRESIAKNTFNLSYKKEDYTSNVLYQSLESNILPYIRNNPHIQFDVYFPPYSYLTYKDMREKGWLEHALELKNMLVKESYKNLILHDFQCDISVVGDLNNYKDISHFSPVINRYIIDSIKEKKHVITQDNLDKCSDIVRRSSLI